MSYYAVAARGVAGDYGQNAADAAADAEEEIPVSPSAKIQFQAENEFQAKWGHSIPPTNVEEAEWYNDRIAFLKVQVAQEGGAPVDPTSSGAPALAPSMTPRTVQFAFVAVGIGALLWFLNKGK